jgi:hypothetical protein
MKYKTSQYIYSNLWDVRVNTPLKHRAFPFKKNRLVNTRIVLYNDSCLLRKSSDTQNIVWGKWREFSIKQKTMRVTGSWSIDPYI